MMKRLFCILLALFMLCGALAMTACTEADKPEETTTAETTTAETTTAETTTEETTTEETTTEKEKPVIESYAIFDYNGVTFTYPASWQKVEGETSIVVDALTGNNISVVRDLSGFDYTSLTKEVYEAELIPQMEAMGVTVTDLSVEQVKNKLGTKITVIAYTVDMSGSAFTQTQYIAKAGNVSHVVTITEMVENADLLDAVFGSLSVSEVEVSTANKVYDNRAISFEYPGAWSESNSGGTVLLTDGSGNNITVAAEAKTDYYQTMTLDDFKKDIEPSLTELGMTVSGVSIEQTENANGVSLTVIKYDLSFMGISMGQTLYVTSVGSDTYAVTVTEVTENTGLPETVFDTLKITYVGE